MAPSPSHPYAALGAAVLRQAFLDLDGVPLRAAAARAWLLGEGPRLWAALAGIELEALRAVVRHRAFGGPVLQTSRLCP